MYDKKYRLENIEEFGKHNPVYDNMLGRTCYLDRFNVGQFGMFVYEDDFGLPHRIRTSWVNEVDENTDDRVIITTQNTRLTFVVVEDTE